MKKLIIISAVILLLLCSCTTQNTVDGELTVYFADVGKADLIILKCGDRYGLIDAGYKANRDKADEILGEFGVKTLDFALATHNDKDHIGGMAHIIEKYSPETLYITPLKSSEKQYKNMLDAAALKGTDVKELKKGGGFSFGGAVFDVLSPDDSLLALNNENESSIVLKMRYGDNSVLFMGDAQIKSEEVIISYYKSELLCDVIKIGHHGSSKASSQVFLSKTKARYAVISTGDDEPAADVTLKAVSECGMKLYNTDTDGDIIMTTDGKNITFKAKGK